jgi:hypothetical protein
MKGFERRQIKKSLSLPLLHLTYSIFSSVFRADHVVHLRLFQDLNFFEVSDKEDNSVQPNL